MERHSKKQGDVERGSEDDKLIVNDAPPHKYNRISIINILSVTYGLLP